MGAEWECERCGQTVDAKYPHTCEVMHVAAHMAEQNEVHEEEIDDRLDRVERRQRMLAGAVLAEFALQRGGGAAMANLAAEFLGIPQTFFAGDRAETLINPVADILLKEWEGEL